MSADDNKTRVLTPEDLPEVQQKPLEFLYEDASAPDQGDADFAFKKPEKPQPKFSYYYESGNYPSRSMPEEPDPQLKRLSEEIKISTFNNYMRLQKAKDLLENARSIDSGIAGKKLDVFFEQQRLVIEPYVRNVIFNSVAHTKEVQYNALVIAGVFSEIAGRVYNSSPVRGVRDGAYELIKDGVSSPVQTVWDNGKKALIVTALTVSAAAGVVAYVEPNSVKKPVETISVVWKKIKDSWSRGQSDHPADRPVQRPPSSINDGTIRPAPVPHDTIPSASNPELKL